MSCVCVSLCINNVWGQFHMKVSSPVTCHWAWYFTLNQIHISAAHWPKIQTYSSSMQLPWCAVSVCSLSSFWSGSIKNDRPTLSHLIRREYWIHEACRIFRKLFLRPSIALCSLAWMQRVGVRPLGHRTDNTPPDGSLLWPVTQRSWGPSRVNRD